MTRALAAADDPQLAAELVVERRALRAELQELRASAAGVVDLAGERARRGGER